MQSQAVDDDRRYALSLLRRLEQYPRRDLIKSQVLDLNAWRDLCREYGLTPEDDDAAVWAAWSALLAETHPETHAERPQAECPTVAVPATTLKVEVMRARASRGESVFHPADALLLQPRMVLVPDKGRHNNRSQVIGVATETHLGPRMVG